jgi:CheY-like chemotaxis protein
MGGRSACARTGAARPSGSACGRRGLPRRWPDDGRQQRDQRRILVVDDESSVRESVGYALEQEGFEVTLAADGEDAEGKLTDDHYDLLILDIMMPGKSGLDICREVRSQSPVPIILLTAKDAEVDKVVGLEAVRTTT